MISNIQAFLLPDCFVIFERKKYFRNRIHYGIFRNEKVKLANLTLHNLFIHHKNPAQLGFCSNLLGLNMFPILENWSKNLVVIIDTVAGYHLLLHTIWSKLVQWFVLNPMSRRGEVFNVPFKEILTP